MAVFTTLDEQEIAAFIARYRLGELLAWHGISEGMENSNYLLTTSASHLADEMTPAPAEYVLTVLEELPVEHLDFHVRLLDVLARHHLPVAQPLRDVDGHATGLLRGKPALLTPKLSGGHVQQPAASHCVAVGTFLADMHLAAAELPDEHSGIRDQAWLEQCVLDASAHLDDADRQWVDSVYRRWLQLDRRQLPRGIIHGDLFRDNVFFDDQRLTGVIDFYNAGSGYLLFDVAVAVNDWCRSADDALDMPRCRALLQAYGRHRPFTASEQQAWPQVLQLAALRFWLSRLLTNAAGSNDRHELFVGKNPAEFRRLLAWHCEHSLAMD